MRNIGTRAAPLNLGRANTCGLIYSLATTAQDFKVQRVYCSNTRTGMMTGDNSSKNITEENVYGDYADAVDVMAVPEYEAQGHGRNRRADRANVGLWHALARLLHQHHGGPHRHPDERADHRHDEHK